MDLVNVNLVWTIMGTFAALSIGSAIRLVSLRHAATDLARKRIGSLKVWWVLTLLWSAAALMGPWGISVLLLIVSTLAMREYLRLVGTIDEIGYGAIACLIGGGLAHYGLILVGAIDLAKYFLPIALLLSLAVVRTGTGDPVGYLRLTAGVYWGAILIIYGLSHLLFLFSLPSAGEPAVGMVGWLLYLVVLSEMNDIMQAIVGRRFGRHRVTPIISPNKTLEGCAGGLVTSLVLAVVLAPFLTTLWQGRDPLPAIGLSALVGAVISVAGFLGDLNMSAIKRDAGVKDGSALLPGMGGMIDRIDSLTFTGPVFYYFSILVHHSSESAS